MPSSSRDLRYETNRNRRESRENAKPPTVAQIFADNHKNRERCTMTDDLFNAPKPKRRAKR